MNYLYWTCNKCNFKGNLHMNLRCIECVKKQKERIRKVAIICRDRRRKQQVNVFSQQFINNIITNITSKIINKERDINLYLAINYKKVRFDLSSDSDSEYESKSQSESESNESDYIMFNMSDSSDSEFDMCNISDCEISASSHSKNLLDQQDSDSDSSF